MEHITIVIGARPNFMKAFPVYESLKKNFKLTLIHTGQHFDEKMNDVFFNQLKFPYPDIQLNLKKKTKSGEFDDKLYVNNTHYLKNKDKVIEELMTYDGDLGQLGEIRDKLKIELKKIQPDLVIVFGDVTSTLAAGLAAKKLNIDLAHIESGLRSGDIKMPEEVNRILTDHITKYYFVTEQSGVDNLKEIGITENVFLVGNTMIDTQKKYLQQALDTKYHEKLGVKTKKYVLITLHRPSNVDNIEKLKEIFDDFEKMSKTEILIYPIHPRIKSNLQKLGYLQKFQKNPNIIMEQPLGYLELTCLLANCKYIVTDSGGLQEESTSLNIPCFTLRENTERPCTLIKNNGTNKMINKICEIEFKELSKSSIHHIDYNIVRNHEILPLIKNKIFLNKTILYGLDIHMKDIISLNNNYHKILTQSEKLKNLYIENGVDKNKFIVAEPSFYKYNFNLPERIDNDIRLIYCGTLRDEENILEIIDEFQKIHKERPEVLLKIVYGKIHGNLEFKKKINEYIYNGVDGITFKHDLTHKEACYEIASSDIGICWRKVGYGENGEVSTKIKEYEMYNLKIISKLDHKIYVAKSIKCLAIFGNIQTSNASSILINSLINTFQNINFDIYVMNDKISMTPNENLIEEYENYYVKSFKYDRIKKLLFINEIRHLDLVDYKLNKKHYNVIFCWSNPYEASDLGCALSKKFNIPCVLRLGDFYVSDFAKKRLNNYIISDSINVPNKILKNKVLSYYAENNSNFKINVIPQHFNPPLCKIKNDNEYVYNKHIINILHAGNMYQERKIDPLIEALGKLDKSILSNINLKFIGCHDKLKDDIDLCKKYNINCDFKKCYQFEDWKFTKSIPFEKIRDEFVKSDILIHLEYIANDNHFLSFKLIDYLSYDKPIITITQKNSPNHLLSKECEFGFGDIENPNHLLKALQNICTNPANYIPNKNKYKYNVDIISKKWENEIIKNSKKWENEITKYPTKQRNYEWINLLKNDYDEKKLNLWIENLKNTTFYNIQHAIKKNEELYTIWVMTTPFSETLFYSMQNLNYLGYRYKIVLNDNQSIALNYMKNNTKTKYWLTFDDDFIMMKDSIEYMVMIKSRIKEPVCIFRLYDLNYGYKHKCEIDCYARYGIKIHDTEICKKLEYDNNINSDLFYKKLDKYGGYINYEDYQNKHYHDKIDPGKIVGYHELFSSPFKVFCLFLKMGTKFKLYNQDSEILWNFLY